MKTKRSEVAQSCLTPCKQIPRTIAYQAPWSMEIFQARVLEWVAISFSRAIFPTQGSNSGLLHCRPVFTRLRLTLLTREAHKKPRESFIHFFQTISALTKGKTSPSTTNSENK